jgi:hypothetical protein
VGAVAEAGIVSGGGGLGGVRGDAGWCVVATVV